MHYYSRQQADIIPKAVTGEQGSANGTTGEYKFAKDEIEFLGFSTFCQTLFIEHTFYT